MLAVAFSWVLILQYLYWPYCNIDRQKYSQSICIVGSYCKNYDTGKVARYPLIQNIPHYNPKSLVKANRILISPYFLTCEHLLRATNSRKKLLSKSVLLQAGETRAGGTQLSPPSWNNMGRTYTKTLWAITHYCRSRLGLHSCFYCHLD